MTPAKVTRARMMGTTSIVVKDPEPVFDWTSKNLAADTMVRQVAKGVNYEAMKGGAWISTCSADNPDFGWMVQIVVKNRETADRIVSAWKRQVDRCDIMAIGT
jgi:hypothetical protein